MGSALMSRIEDLRAEVDDAVSDTVARPRSLNAHGSWRPMWRSISTSLGS